MTKIDIISGFLGAGKTTFIKQLLKEAVKGEKVILIENEFGEIGIDGGFLKDSGVEIREMNSGCICCSLVGDFGKSLSEVLSQYAPDRVIIEPSGVGKLSDVLKAVRDVASEIEVALNSAVTVVDASKCRMYMKNFGEFFNNQIENAGTIVLSRTDITDPKKVQAAVEMIREKNQKAVIITTPCSSLNGAQFLEIIEKEDDMAEELMKEAREHLHEFHHHEHEAHKHGKGCCCGGHEHEAHEHGEGCGCHDHDHHAEEVFMSWGRENVPSVSRERLEEVLDDMAYSTAYGEILRAKGMIPGGENGKWLHFDLVPEQVEIREGEPDYTGKVCIIGARLKEDKLAEVFSE